MTISPEELWNRLCAVNDQLCGLSDHDCLEVVTVAWGALAASARTAEPNTRETFLAEQAAQLARLTYLAKSVRTDRPDVPGAKARRSSVKPSTLRRWLAKELEQSVVVPRRTRTRTA